ncbi:MAG TPA: hypothetical protein VGR69_02525 [Candidatus Rubrimentiphilum sp.]|nr:hypothetical protein [Candidatus Rubrimentiphilum sp.]
MTRGFDPAMYVQALPLYARNLGVLLPPLVAALISVGLGYFSAWFFAASGGAGTPFISLIATIIYGFAFAVSVIFADDAWRHGRASLGAAWNSAQRKAGNILVAVIGFLFLTWVARIIGGVGGPTLSLAIGALAVWAFIYAIPAAAIGGIPGGASLSASLQGARRHPLATAVLVIVCIVVWIGINNYAVAYLPFRDGAYDVAEVILKALALGYVALVIAKQYNELAFRAFW